MRTGTTLKRSMVDYRHEQANRHLEQRLVRMKCDCWAPDWPMTQVEMLPGSEMQGLAALPVCASVHAALC